MKIKTRVVLTERASDNPFYKVQMFNPLEGWITMRCCSFKWGEQGIWAQDKAEEEALIFAKQLEGENKPKETVIYQTPDESTLPSPN